LVLRANSIDFSKTASWLRASSGRAILLER
jgi:hypothetical protein